MPYLSIQTNQSPDSAVQEALLQQASALVSRLLGKPENYVMVAIESNTAMSFAGSRAPLAYLELKSIGLPETDTPAFSQALTELITAALDVPPDRVYIEFANASRHLWGWNGETF